MIPALAFKAKPYVESLKATSSLSLPKSQQHFFQPNRFHFFSILISIPLASPKYISNPRGAFWRPNQGKKQCHFLTQIKPLKFCTVWKTLWHFLVAYQRTFFVLLQFLTCWAVVADQPEVCYSNLKLHSLAKIAAQCARLALLAKKPSRVGQHLGQRYQGWGLRPYPPSSCTLQAILQCYQTLRIFYHSLCLLCCVALCKQIKIRLNLNVCIV